MKTKRVIFLNFYMAMCYGYDDLLLPFCPSIYYLKRERTHLVWIFFPHVIHSSRTKDIIILRNRKSIRAIILAHQNE